MPPFLLRAARLAGLAFILLDVPAVASAWAETQPDNGRGEQIAKPCLACHGSGIRIGTPPVSVPFLAGQNAAYLERALQSYASGKRRNLIMQAQARSLDAQAMADIATYFAGERMKPPPPNSAGAIPAAVVQICSACHGETGLASMPEVAVLSGQHPDYIIHALHAYASGERQNGVMPVFARQLSEAQRQDVAAYFARFGALHGRP